PDFCRDCGDLPRRKPATETQGTPPNVGCCLLRTSTGPHRTLVGHSHVEATPERRGRIGADPCRRRRPGGSGVPVGRRRRPLEEEEEEEAEEEEHEEAKDEGLRD
ncbi:unnamed protein product, partial [Prorocentrum cordatum]